MELLRPILELGVVIPGMLLAYFPVKSSLKQPLSSLFCGLFRCLRCFAAAGEWCAMRAACRLRRCLRG